MHREYAKVRRCKHTAEQRRDSGESHGMGVRREEGMGKGERKVGGEEETLGRESD